MERQQSPKAGPPATTSAPRPSPASLDARGLREDDIAQIVHDLKDPISTIALETYFLRIERVVANLIGNALKYAPKHGGIVRGAGSRFYFDLPALPS